MWLIVGLGNPTPKYELTRHNAGFLAVDALLDKFGVNGMQKAFSSEAYKINHENLNALVLKPQTYMNKSGLAVQQAMAFHKIPLSSVVVLHDELDLPLGSLRIKQGGSNGGHNGLKDISRLLGDNFVRIRIGIGRPTFKGDEANYVLSPFSNSEIKLLEPVLAKTIEAILGLTQNNLEYAQQHCQLNGKS